ncbi:transcriptional regulator, XRE family [Denitrovibrio acetiphilus DSM 12809]|uniref:Transcriptional regulator, XRE family n=1 Tax=Denitrovibrio acetiphilus (strain DSM 12809 / NBRC 114555 / N2460) TaxID=522772 RepID=D4H433_DENA2|nr:helix-turn-helix transcriptional regulator [Denitrovibrio acetiphilus]ADD67344.1 transcriptional regulator, XRE family [Denitrovibrio acetiphilus DSM 12809]
MIATGEKTLGEMLRYHIEAKGFKQADICRKTGLSPSRLCNYLKDAREPDWKTLCKIVDAIRITLNDLRD